MVDPLNDSTDVLTEVCTHTVDDFASKSERLRGTGGAEMMEQVFLKVEEVPRKQKSHYHWRTLLFWSVLSFSLGCLSVVLLQSMSTSALHLRMPFHFAADKLKTLPAPPTRLLSEQHSSDHHLSEHHLSEHHLSEQHLPDHEARAFATILFRLNPQSVRSTREWTDIETLKGQLNFGILNITYENPDALSMELQGGSRLIADRNVARLLDANGEEVGNIIMGPFDFAANLQPETREVRSLSGSPPINVPPPIQGVYKAYPSEMYCRYGCGNVMGVTFPYYYRPFFGYGFPLLGTEPYFPAGYGGNSLTALGATGALGAPGPPGSAVIPV